MSNRSQVEWKVPGSVDREPQYFCATRGSGNWRFMSKYAMEVRWYRETATPELIERAISESRAIVGNSEI